MNHATRFQPQPFEGENHNMIRMFVRHEVKDYKTWRKGYDGFDAERRTMGVKDDAVFRSADDSDNVTVWHDFETLAKAKKFAGSDHLKEVMKHAGVKSKPEIWFTKAAK
jgi:hypothetical protein